MRPHRAAPAAALAAVLGASGCDGAPPASDPPDAGAGGYLPYEGVAFPSRRAPIAVPAGGLALVADAQADTLTAVDVAGASAVTTLPIGRDPITPDGPSAIALHPPSGSVYVLLPYERVHADLHAKGEPHAQPAYVQKLAAADLSILGEVEIPEEPRGLAVSEDGARLVTVHFSSPGELAAQISPDALEAARGRLSIIDTASIEPVFSETPSYVTTCIGARDVALSPPDGARVFVACSDEDAVAVVDLSGAEPAVQRVPAGPEHGLPGLPVHGPAALAVSADGSAVYLANELAKEVRRLDVTSGPALAASSIATEGTPAALAMTADGDVLVLTRDPGAILLVPATLDGPPLQKGALAPADCPVPVALARAGAGRLVVTCASPDGAPGRVLVLDAAKLSIVGSAAAGAEPRAVTVVPGGAP